MFFKTGLCVLVIHTVAVIDNTLATTPTDLGSDQWFTSLLTKKLDTGHSTTEALAAALPPYYHAQHHSWLEPTEPETVSTLKKLQDEGITVISLTARGVYLLYRTLEQLHRLDIDFTKTSPSQAVAPYGVHSPAIYINGIIFAGAQNKGEVLNHWLDHLHFKPKKIIFVDDKSKNVLSVKQAMKTAQHPFVGIRYGLLDQRVANLDMHKTEQEYQTLLESNPDRKPISLTV